MKPDVDESPSLTERLAELLLRPVDERSRDHARLHLADWIGFTAAAGDSEEGEILRGYAEAREGGRCFTWFAGRRSPEVAMLVNSGLGLVLELDDVHREAKLHPGPIVIPAALAAAECRGSTCDELLAAIVRGYEAMIRIGESVGAEHYRLWHTTSTCGTFGAAAAAGSLLGLDVEQLSDALGNAGTQSSGLWQTRPERTMSKPLHAGRAANAGVIAAELAASGFTGPRRILEGELGMYAATAPDADPTAVAGGSPDWRIHRTSIKPWPGCRHIHPAITAILDLVSDGSVERHVATGIDVDTYGVALDFADDPAPTSTAAALFSLQHATAWTLLHGPPEQEAFEPVGLAEPAVVALRDQVRVRRDSIFDAAYPARWGARVTVISRGESHEVTVRDALGDPERPLTVEQVTAKFHRLLERAGFTQAPGVIDACLDLPGSAPVSDLTNHLDDLR